MLGLFSNHCVCPSYSCTCPISTATETHNRVFRMGCIADERSPEAICIIAGLTYVQRLQHLSISLSLLISCWLSNELLWPSWKCAIYHGALPAGYTAHAVVLTKILRCGSNSTTAFGVYQLGCMMHFASNSLLDVRVPRCAWSSSSSHAFCYSIMSLPMTDEQLCYSLCNACFIDWFFASIH